MDLLRIVSMLLIIFLHSIDHSGVLEAAVPGTWMYYYVYFGYYLAQVCVNCFVLLSGYFMIGSRARPSKLISLWLEVVFYSLVIRIIFFATGQRSFSIGSLISCFFPVMTGRYWFITIYFGLYLISPFLNIAIRAMTKKTVHCIERAVVPAVFRLEFPTSVYGGDELRRRLGTCMVCCAVLCGSMVQDVSCTRQKNTGKGGLVFILVPLCVTLLLYVANTLNIGIAQKVIHHWYSYNAAPAYLMSLGLLELFINIDVKSTLISRTATKIAPLTLGVYLIHKHADVSPWMWEALNMPQYMEHWSFPAVQLGVTIGVFAVCILMDLIRERIFRMIRLSRINGIVDARLTNMMGIEK